VERRADRAGEATPVSAEGIGTPLLAPGLPPDARQLRSASRPWVRPVVAGSGPPVVVLPTAQGDWHCLLPAFAPLAARHRVALLSLRGERGHDVARDFTWDDLVEDVDEAARLAGFERHALVGTSFGGAVALQHALARPERVTRLVLNVTTARLRDHARTAALVRRLPVGPRAAAFHAWAVVACTPELAALPWRARREALARIRAFMPWRTPGPTLMRRIELLLSLDVEERLGAISCPALVLSGEERLDRLVPRRSQAALLRRLPDVRHAVVAGTGHLGILTRPDAVRTPAEAFLSGADAGL